MRDVRPWKPSEIRQAIEWRDQGVSYRIIAARLGRNRGSVCTMFQRQSVEGSLVQKLAGSKEFVPDNEADSAFMLKRATINAMLRWANDNGTTIDTAAKFLLSGEKITVYPQQHGKKAALASFASVSAGA